MAAQSGLLPSNSSHGAPQCACRCCAVSNTSCVRVPAQLLLPSSHRPVNCQCQPPCPCGRTIVLPPRLPISNEPIFASIHCQPCLCVPVAVCLSTNQSVPPPPLLGLGPRPWHVCWLAQLRSFGILWSVTAPFYSCDHLTTHFRHPFFLSGSLPAAVFQPLGATLCRRGCCPHYLPFHA